MRESIDTERIRTMIRGRMGFVPQEFADEIQSLIAQAWDEGFAAKEAAMRDPHGTGWEPNPYRTETR